MHSAILGCERSTDPVLLHCLHDESHDWRHLQLVNRSMCAAFRQYKVQVAEYMAKRELRKHLSRQVPSPHTLLMPEMWADFERAVIAIEPRNEPRIEPRNEPRMVFSLHHIYANNVFDDSFDHFVRGSRTVNLLLFSPAEETPVIEVD